MNRPGFVEGAGLAFTGSLLAGAAWSVLTPLLPLPLLARVLVTSLAGGYLLYLLVRGCLRVGRVSAFAGWLLISAALWLLGAPLLAHVLAQAAALWLLRVIAFRAGALGALAELALVGVGLLAAAWAMLQTGSVALAVWSLLLVQAVFPLLPRAARHGRSDASTDAGHEDPFEHAHRAAQAALVRLASHR